MQPDMNDDRGHAMFEMDGPRNATIHLVVCTGMRRPVCL